MQLLLTLTEITVSLTLSATLNLPISFGEILLANADKLQSR